MRKAAVLGFLAPIIVLAVAKFIPHLGGQAQSIDSTPAVQPLRELTDVKLEPGQTLCVSGLVLGPDSRFVRFLRPVRRAGVPPLTVTANAPGYRSVTRTSRNRNAPREVTVPLKAPTTERDGASICVRNDGRRNTYLIAVPPGLDATVSESSVNGRPIPEYVTVTLLKDPSASRLSNLPAMLDRASAFTPFGPWAAWLLSALLVVGVPAALGVALVRSCPEDGN
jgi:hypothetical protein